MLIFLTPNVKSCAIARINTIRHLCCTTPQMLNKLNRIDKNHIPRMSQISFFFFLLAKYSQCTSTCNAYLIHKIILVPGKDRANPHNTQRKLFVTSLLCNGMSHCAMVRSAAHSAPIGLYTTSLLVLYNTKY